MTTRPAEDLLIELSGITKRYAGVTALSGVDLQIRRGEVHGLIGENGAGKSTLIKILSGAERPQAGEYRVDGKQVEVASPRDARALGVAVLHQERNLVPTFTVGENVMLDEILSSPFARVDRRSIARRSAEFLTMLDIPASPSDPVDGLSSARAQLVELARALTRNASLLILDEPTASLAVGEAQRLLGVIRELRDRGVSVLYVSHKLEEVFEICDRVTVVRDGRNVANAVRIGDLDWDRLVGLMVGREHAASTLPVRTVPDAEPRLVVRELTGHGSEHPASFSVRPGEILGWYGLVGAGRTELARVLIGAERRTGGAVLVDGAPARIRNLRQAIHRYGFGYVSEDRQREGLFLMHSIAVNRSAVVWHRLQRRLGLFDPRRETEAAEADVERFAIRSRSVAQEVGTLSGGNKQKVSVAKWLASEPRILIIDEPTVGIDIVTKYEIHDLVVELAERGISIILISSDLPETIRLADRVLVFAAGQIVGEVENEKSYDTMSQRIMSMIVDRRRA